MGCTSTPDLTFEASSIQGDNQNQLKLEMTKIAIIQSVSQMLC